MSSDAIKIGNKLPPWRCRPPSKSPDSIHRFQGHTGAGRQPHSELQPSKNRADSNTIGRQLSSELIPDNNCTRSGFDGLVVAIRIGQLVAIASTPDTAGGYLSVAISWRRSSFLLHFDAWCCRISFGTNS